jgi:TolB-like protein
MDFLEELKRRNVVRVGIAYLVVAWLVAQIADLILDNIQSPEWVMQTILLLLALGLPLALLLAWAFELTPEGIKKEKNVDRSESIVSSTGRKLDYAIIFLLVIALLYFVWESRFSDQDSNIAATASSGSNSIAVLPFTNLASSEQGDPFVDGLHDDLLTQLSKLVDLKVISRTSVLEYRDTTKNMRQIGLELGVKTLLEGGVQRVGDRIRLNVQLIDAESDEHLWAETYDRELTMDNIFDVQSEITSTIAKALKVAMSDDVSKQIATAPTQDISTYELYQEIQKKLDADLDQTSLESYISRLELALAKEASFALGFAQLSLLYTKHYWEVEKSSEVRAKALAAVQSAFNLQANLIEAHIAMAHYHYYGWLNYPAALEEIAKAKAINPNNANALEVESYVLRRSGDVEGSIPVLKKALELNPRSVTSMGVLADNYAFVRDFQSAGNMLDRMEEFTLKDPSDIRNLSRSMLIGNYLNDIQLETYLDFAEDAPPAQVLSIVFQLMKNGDNDKSLELANAQLNNKDLNADLKEQLLWFKAINTFVLYSLEKAEPLFLEEETKLQRKLLEDPNNINTLISAIVLNTLLGDGQAAKNYFERLEPLILARNDFQEMANLELFRAASFGAAGDFDQAIDTLNTYFELPVSDSVKTTSNYPFFLWLRDHPRFPELVDAYGLTTPGAEALYSKDSPKYKAQYVL